MPYEVLFFVFLGCSTGLVYFIVDRIFPKRSQREHKEIQQLRENVRHLEERMQNVETIVTGAEFQAAQRIANALDSGSTVAEKNTLGTQSRLTDPMKGGR